MNNHPTAWARLALAFVCMTGLTFAGQAGPDRGPAAQGFPALKLNGHQRGRMAVTALGARLPEVARAYGWTSTDLYALLLRDPALAVDPGGRLHFTDAAPAAAEGAALSAPVTAAVPLAETFMLHSKPGSLRTIFLDFDGHVLAGTAWNSGYNGGNVINAPAFDLDGDPASFNDAERTLIQQVWQRVAEDFAPFDVDVTTELAGEDVLTRSSNADLVYGVRVLISSISQYFGNYGGIAYVGTFDDVGDIYKPALVFPENLANTAKYIAEACAHETGHTLGLLHDGVTAGSAYYSGQGTGETGWAPIMGSSYSRNLTQWSRGEYAAANNTQDDLAVMQTYGLAHRADDHGDSAASASYFPAGTQLEGYGLIERNTDVDVFAFSTGNGPVNLTFNPAGLGANLDVQAELRDAAGNVLAVADAPGSLSANLSLDLSAGTYFLHLRGVGAGDPLSTGYTAYASLGQYAITGSVAADVGPIAPVAVATVSATTAVTGQAVTFDGSGSFDQDGAVVAHAWDFGDGTSATGAQVSKAYNAPGSYTGTLTVTDAQGLTGSTAFSVSVIAPNIPPNAAIAASATAGPAPLTVTFDASGSADPDGTLTGYSWDFGDGTSGTGLTVSKTFSTAGSYTATLTVTDDRGGTGTASVLIQVSASAAKIVRVESIILSPVSSKSGNSVKAVVRVTNLDGTPVSGVRVSGSWSGLITGSSSGNTDANGTATLTSKNFKASGSVTFAVSGLVKSGFTYGPASNLQTSAELAVPGSVPDRR